MPLEASKANPSEAVRCTVEVRLSLGHQKAALESFWALLAGLGSCLGGVWLCRMGCREVGFWCGGAFCTVEFHLSLRGFGWFGLVSRWCLVVWLFRTGCREVGFWCGGAFCTVEFHFSLGHQKVTLESFLALRVWLVGLESCWGFPVSDAC